MQTRYQVFIKGYGILSFAKNMGKSIGKYSGVVNIVQVC